MPETSCNGGAATAAPPGHPLIEDMAQARRKMAALLEIDEPVSEAVVAGAVDDPLYAMHLLASRGSPSFLRLLLDNPPRRRPSPAAGDASVEPDGGGAGGSAALLLRFSKAMVEWGKSGFRKAEPELVERRLAACAACPNLSAPKGSILTRLSAAAGLGDRSCGLCGCVVASKATLATERCPGEDPRRPGFTRWGDAVAEPRAAPPPPPAVEALHG